MKTLNKRITLITNVILIALVYVVFAVGFLPQTEVPIYGGNQLKAIYHGNKANQTVSLMFNVYENSDVVSGILDLLNENDAKATFFVGGCWADDNEQLLKRIVSEGQEIANHGYFHKDHKKLSLEGNVDEIEKTNVMIEALCGVKPTLFAPPSGSFSSLTLEASYSQNCKVIMWTKDTIDWRDSDQSLIIKRATKNVENGDFILMHPKPHTLKALPKIIEFYKGLNFSLVTVSQSLA